MYFWEGDGYSLMSFVSSKMEDVVWSNLAQKPLVSLSFCQLPELVLNKKSPRFREGFLLWCLQELNQGHMDFQSIALPTELRHQKSPVSCRTLVISWFSKFAFQKSFSFKAIANLYPFY